MGVMSITSHVKGCEKEETGRFERKVSGFRLRAIDPWFDLPFSHLMIMSVIFLLFLVALFSDTGGQ